MDYEVTHIPGMNEFIEKGKIESKLPGALAEKYFGNL